jgi:hypothetical protein
MGTTVPETVEHCIRDKAINFKLILHLVGCFIEYLKMHGTTNPKSRLRLVFKSLIILRMPVCHACFFSTFLELVMLLDFGKDYMLLEKLFWNLIH